jgi:hypothetical protein
MNMGWGPRALMHLGLKLRALCAPITSQGSPAALLKLQMAPRLILISPGFIKKEPRYECVSEAKASHRQRMWVEVSSSFPHFLHIGLSVIPIKWRCLRRVLRPVTTLDCILLKDESLTSVPRHGPEITPEPVAGYYRGPANACSVGSPASDWSYS